jgi:hypothetical protein
MEQFAFRCFEKKEKIWIFQHITLDSVEFPEYLKMIYSSDPERYAVSIGTGIADKNGLALYEHDFVRFRDKLYMIYYDPPEFVMECLVGEPDMEIYVDECEYAGNLYDNPELYEKIIAAEAEKLH